jgi:hypothetical protein
MARGWRIREELLVGVQRELEPTELPIRLAKIVE